MTAQDIIAVVTLVGFFLGIPVCFALYCLFTDRKGA